MGCISRSVQFFLLPVTLSLVPVNIVSFLRYNTTSAKVSTETADLEN